MIIYVGICLILSCGVKVVSPCYRRWRNNLNELLDGGTENGGVENAIRAKLQG